MERIRVHTSELMERAKTVSYTHLEKDLSGEALCKKVQGLFENPDTIPTFAANAKKMAILDANERIYHIIKEIIK